MTAPLPRTLLCSLLPPPPFSAYDALRAGDGATATTLWPALLPVRLLVVTPSRPRDVVYREREGVGGAKLRPGEAPSEREDW